MRLTKEKLFRLIRESVEERWHGSKVKSAINAPKYDKDDLAWWESNIGPKLGSGYSRIVFELDDKMVLKVAYTSDDYMADSFQEGVQSNRMEYQLFNKYPQVFPKSYGMFKDGELLVVERVYVIDDSNKFNRVLRNCFPSLVEGAKLLKNNGYDVTYEWVWDRVLDSWDELVVGKDEEAPTRWEEFEFAIQSSRKTRGIPDKLLQALWDVVTYDTRLMDWVTTLRGLGVEFDEIRVGNVGTNANEDKLFMIDISKFQFGES